MIECVLAEQLLAIEFIDGNQSGDHRFGWRCLGISNGLLENYAVCGPMNGDVSQPDLFLALGVADAEVDLPCRAEVRGKAADARPGPAGLYGLERLRNPHADVVR